MLVYVYGCFLCCVVQCQHVFVMLLVFFCFFFLYVPSPSILLSHRHTCLAPAVPSVPAGSRGGASSVSLQRSRSDVDVNAAAVAKYRHVGQTRGANRLPPNSYSSLGKSPDRQVRRQIKQSRPSVSRKRDGRTSKESSQISAGISWCSDKISYQGWNHRLALFGAWTASAPLLSCPPARPPVDLLMFCMFCTSLFQFVHLQYFCRNSHALWTCSYFVGLQQQSAGFFLVFLIGILCDGPTQTSTQLWNGREIKAFEKCGMHLDSSFNLVQPMAAEIHSSGERIYKLLIIHSMEKWQEELSLEMEAMFTTRHVGDAANLRKSFPVGWGKITMWRKTDIVHYLEHIIPTIQILQYNHSYSGIA